MLRSRAGSAGRGLQPSSGDALCRPKAERAGGPRDSWMWILTASARTAGKRSRRLWPTVVPWWRGNHSRRQFGGDGPVRDAPEIPEGLDVVLEEAPSPVRGNVQEEVAAPAHGRPGGPHTQGTQEGGVLHHSMITVTNAFQEPRGELRYLKGRLLGEGGKDLLRQELRGAHRQCRNGQVRSRRLLDVQDPDLDGAPAEPGYGPPGVQEIVPKDPVRVVGGDVGVHAAQALAPVDLLPSHPVLVAPVQAWIVVHLHHEDVLPPHLQIHAMNYRPPSCPVQPGLLLHVRAGLLDGALRRTCHLRHLERFRGNDAEPLHQPRRLLVEKPVARVLARRSGHCAEVGRMGGGRCKASGVCWVADRESRRSPLVPGRACLYSPDSPGFPDLPEVRPARLRMFPSHAAFPGSGITWTLIEG
jgi:hypothetical protein